MYGPGKQKYKLCDVSPHAKERGVGRRAMRSEQNFRIILPESISTSPQPGSDIQTQSHDKQSNKRPEQFGICQAKSKIKKKEEKKMRLLFYLSLGFYAILLVILFLKLYFTKKNRSLRLKIKTNFENNC